MQNSVKEMKGSESVILGLKWKLSWKFMMSEDTVKDTLFVVHAGKNSIVSDRLEEFICKYKELI